MSEFASERDLGSWFNDMGGAIDFMLSDTYMSKKGSTAEVMDASVLQAINDGWLMYKRQNPIGGGGHGWADFFNSIDPLGLNPSQQPSSDAQLNIARLTAEQAGVDYSWGLMDVQSAYSKSTDFEQVYFEVFKASADNYRSLGTRGSIFDVNLCQSCAGKIDPREWGDRLHSASYFLLPFASVLYGVQQERKRFGSRYPQ